jgi:hypothetical protein
MLLTFCTQKKPSKKRALLEDVTAKKKKIMQKGKDASGPER